MNSPLLSLSPKQWEDLCDGCGRCCLVKLQDEDTEALFYTNIACQYLDPTTCRCTEYTQRAKKKPECIVLSHHNLEVLQWLPLSCAYRRFDRGELPLTDIAEISVRNKVVSEVHVHPEQYEDHVIDWIELEG